LKIARSMPLADVLVSELRAFRVSFTAGGRPTFGNDQGDALWREAEHDDLVLALSLGLWRAETRPKPLTPELKKRLVPW
jgi:hypothetical protein